jgi:hypothetical protein
MCGKDLKENKGGQILSMDLLLALVLFSVLLGVSANAMDLVTSKMDESSYVYSLQRITNENANILLNTPGTPENWEEGHQTLSMVKPGLAKVDPITGAVNKTLSIKKISKLGENYQELMDGKVLPFGLNSSMIVSPRDSSLETITVNNQEHPDEAKDILIINRTIMCDYMIANALTSIVSNQPSETSSDTYQPLFCPHCNLTQNFKHPREESTSKKPGWKCNPFIVTQNDINTKDIYIMTDPPQVMDESACWIIDSTQNISDSSIRFKSSPLRLNEKLSELLGDKDNATIWVHVFSSGNSDETFNVYIGSFLKNTSSEKVKTQYLTPQPCNFVFKVWI